MTVIYECEWLEYDDYVSAWAKFGGRYSPPFTRKVKTKVTTEELLAAVKSDDIFGIIECDIKVSDFSCTFSMYISMNVLNYI